MFKACYVKTDAMLNNKIFEPESIWTVLYRRTEEVAMPNARYIPHTQLIYSHVVCTCRGSGRMGWQGQGWDQSPVFGWRRHEGSLADWGPLTGTCIYKLMDMKTYWMDLLKLSPINSVPTKCHIISWDKCLVHIIIAWKVIVTKSLFMGWKVLEQQGVTWRHLPEEMKLK